MVKVTGGRRDGVKTRMRWNDERMRKEWKNGEQRRWGGGGSRWKGENGNRRKEKGRERRGAGNGAKGVEPKLGEEGGKR